MRIEVLHQWCQPSGGSADVAVKQHYIFVVAVQGFYGTIIPTCIAVVFIEIYRVYPTGEFGLKQLP